MRSLGTSARRRPSRSLALDVSLAGALALADAALLYFGYRDFWLPAPAVTACGIITALALVVRRRYPVGLAIFTITFGTVTGGAGFAMLIVLYSLGAYSASRRVTTCVAVAGFAAGLALPGPTAGDESFLTQAMFGLAFNALPVVLGLYMGARKQLLLSLQERAARLERELGLLAERARAEERTRIAREMHDVVANRVSIMVVHAGALRAIASRDAEQAAATAAVIGDMGRQALEELRQVVGVLRQGEEAVAASVVTLDELRALAEQSGATGLRVGFRVRGRERPMPPAVGRAVYRVVQEALTNVHKHAGDARTRVEVRMLAEAVEVEVVNEPGRDGPGHRLPSGGNGLVGLHERVTALGGRFVAEPHGSGGWTVVARLPLPTS
ncbi:sensor histidine kinase [Actinomadura flavalba]|uniref:sensor histidine kinase n=1 Tax=Actinomadura flavalba TaxID=1120938 RepID=UPI000377D139|nr:histidine kinase [Actinomadura flavalba]